MECIFVKVMLEQTQAKLNPSNPAIAPKQSKKTQKNTRVSRYPGTLTAVLLTADTLILIFENQIINVLIHFLHFCSFLKMCRKDNHPAP